MNINSWLEDELYQQYLHDRGSVDESWKGLFEHHPAQGERSVRQGSGRQLRRSRPAPPEELIPLRGASARIAQNMEASLSIPLATSQRTIPVKVIDENRRIINQHRTLVGKSKVSYTHLIGWAIVKALKSQPGLESRLRRKGRPAVSHRARRRSTSGSRSTSRARTARATWWCRTSRTPARIDFQQYVAAFDDLVSRARKGKLTPADFQGTTISLTNPGTVGTMGSIPRLMPGQGAIIATGAIDYPAEYQGVAPEIRASLGHQQGDDDHLHLRSSHHSGRGIRHVPGQGPGAARRARTASTRKSSRI